jgi:hypothetical protein
VIGLTQETPIPECRSGDQIVHLGRSYQVASMQHPSRSDAHGYVYLAAPGERPA